LFLEKVVIGRPITIIAKDKFTSSATFFFFSKHGVCIKIIIPLLKNKKKTEKNNIGGVKLVYT
jgi:hypothetical protein